MSNSKQDFANEETLDFRTLVYFLWENKYFIVSMTILVMGLAIFYTFLKVPEYEANTLIQVDRHSNNLGGFFGQLGLSVKDANPAISAQMALIRSRVILEPVVHELGLDISMVKALASRLKVEELGEGDSQTGIIQISLKDTNPKRIITILNTIAKITQKKDAERKALETSRTLTFLQDKQLPIIRQELEKAETAYNLYRAESGKLDFKLESQRLLSELAAIQKQLTRANLSQTNLQQKYTLAHPVMIGLKNEIKQLQLQRNILMSEIRRLPASDQIAMNLLRDVKVKNELYIALLKQIQELQVVKAGLLSDVRILALAQEPKTHLPKYTTVVALAGLVLGLILSIILSLARKAFFRKISNPTWIEQNLGLTNLAIIPYSRQQASNVRYFRKRASNSLELLSKTYPRDLSIEALRSLRTSFQMSSLNARNNIVSIMGISQSIGKSFISANFAYLLADIGKRVLLIDGDIRKGHLHHYFNLAQQPGLHEAIMDKSILQNVIHKTSLASLHFLPCGSYPTNPAELLISQAFKNLIDFISPQYDFIIIDTAPILAVTDSIIIGNLASMNFLVIGVDKHQSEEIILAIKRLQNAGIPLQGTIFNTLKPETRLYGTSQYYYYYGDSPSKKERVSKIKILN